MEKVKNQPVQYRAQLDAHLDSYAQEVEEKKAKRHYIDSNRYFLTKLKNELADVFSALGISIENPDKLKIEQPPGHLGFDIAVPVFEYCKVVKKSPQELATLLVEMIHASQNTFIESASAVGGYLNLLLKKKETFIEVIENISNLKDNYGESDSYKNRLVLIDYSSPNIAKPLGVGHLRSTVIGEALARIYHTVGFTVIRDNHLGDWGTQFGALIYAYKKWGNEKEVIADPIETLKNLYVRFTSEAERDPAIKEEARVLFSKLESGDQELMGLWTRFKDLSIQEFEKTYEELNIKFDIALGESYYTYGANELVEDLKSKGLAHDTESGAVAVENLDKLPSFLVKKSDGSTLYALRDLLTIIHRKKVFNPDVILYVVGIEQELNFKQVIALCEAAGYSGATKLKHVGFGLVMVDGRKMSTRKGTLVNLNEVIDKITDKAKDILKEKGEIDNAAIDIVARKIGISAVVYNDLRQNRQSDIEFDWKRMLDLESGSAVYLQYTYVRILSVLNKAADNDKVSPVTLTFNEPIEFRLALKLSFYPEVLKQVIENDTPNLVSDFLEQLASEFNRFYSEINVLSTEDEVLRRSRLYLLKSLLSCMKNGLTALNVAVLEKL